MVRLVLLLFQSCSTLFPLGSIWFHSCSTCVLLGSTWLHSVPLLFHISLGSTHVPFGFHSVPHSSIWFNIVPISATLVPLGSILFPLLFHLISLSFTRLYMVLYTVLINSSRFYSVYSCSTWFHSCSTLVPIWFHLVSLLF